MIMLLIDKTGTVPRWDSMKYQARLCYVEGRREGERGRERQGEREREREVGERRNL